MHRMELEIEGKKYYFDVRRLDRHRVEAFVGNGGRFPQTEVILEDTEDGRHYARRFAYMLLDKGGEELLRTMALTPNEGRLLTVCDICKICSEPGKNEHAAEPVLDVIVSKGEQKPGFNKRASDLAWQLADFLLHPEWGGQEIAAYSASHSSKYERAWANHRAAAQPSRQY